MSRVSRAERLDDAMEVVQGAEPRLPAPAMTQEEALAGKTGHQVILERYIANVTQQVRLRRQAGQKPTEQQEVALRRVGRALVALARGARRGA